MKIFIVNFKLNMKSSSLRHSSSMIRNVCVLLAGKLKLTKYPTLKDLHCSSYQYTVKWILCLVAIRIWNWSF